MVSSSLIQRHKTPSTPYPNYKEALERPVGPPLFTPSLGSSVFSTKICMPGVWTNHSHRQMAASQRVKGMGSLARASELCYCFRILGSSRRRAFMRSCLAQDGSWACLWRNYLDYKGRSVHCGWSHSLARAYELGNSGDSQLSTSSMHSPSLCS